MTEPRRAHRNVTYGVDRLPGDPARYVAHITSWGGQRCRLTTIKGSEPEAVEAAHRWIERAVRERSNPDAPTYRWIADPDAVLTNGFVCARIDEAGETPILE